MKHQTRLPEDMSRVRQLYQAFGAQVDPIMAQRLRHARRRALNAGKGSAIWMRRLVPASALALALVAALMIWQPLQQGSSLPVQASMDAGVTSILPPDADQTDPTLYQNLNFYAWLAQQPATPHDP